MYDSTKPQDNPEYRSRRNREPFDATTVQEGTGMMDYVKTCFKKYADFSGRARRSEYWYFYLFNILVFFALYIPLLALLVADGQELAILPGALLVLYALAIIIPTLAAVSRRLHDTGRSGWYYLMSLIPLVGHIILIVFLVEDSKPGTNAWGPNPKGLGNGDASDPLEKDAFL